ncbi:serine/threonine-protein kinase [Streptomyces phytohabitans]|uniref:serine/threonine-protein kinase n=1 Tax=Streptomyces phytohabitans TaxID=1150371 RepID=UPI00345C1545
MGQDVDEGRLVGGRYRLEGVLGRGGMGTVWSGQDETLGRRVAVKELRFPSSIDDEEKQRLITRTLREAKAIARIRSGSAIVVYDVVNEDDRPWIVMELVEGRSLADRIRKEGPLTPQRVAEIGLAVLDVLRSAHLEGIVHRDVKPSNVLLEEATGRVVLTDFGIAKVAGDPSITSTGMLVGAPSYISPERARGTPPGPPADMWSLGGLLYAAVEGRPPYDKGSAISTLTAVMTEPVPPPSGAGPLTDVILGLLEKDPDKRLDVTAAHALLEQAAALDEHAPPSGPAPAPGSGETSDSRLPVRTASGLPPIPSLSPQGGTGNGPGSWPAASPAGAGMNSRLTMVVVGVVVVLLVLLGVFVANSMGDDGDGDGKKSEGSGQTDGGDKSGRDEGSGKDDQPGSDAEPNTGGRGDDLDDADKGGDKGTDDGADQDGGGDDGKQDGTLPAGYGDVVDERFHFSMAMPDDFQRTGTAGENSGAKYGLPGGGYPRLQVDHSGSPAADAEAAWRKLEPSVRKSSVGYQQIELKSVSWRDYPTVADWQFQRIEGAEQVRVLNRGFRVDDERGYAIMVTCKTDEWTGEKCRTLRDTAFATFQPR